MTLSEKSLNPKNIIVIPSPGAGHHAGLLEDCEVVARLMRKLVVEHQTLTLDEAFVIVKLRLMEICVFDWDAMEPRFIQ